jgi:DNA-directed RNA polymerase omega subunit
LLQGFPFIDDCVPPEEKRLIAQGLEQQEGKIGSSYDLVLLASERAKQIQQGAAPLIRTGSNHPLTIALEEIQQGAYPPKPKEALVPKDLDEEFIGAALAEQNLSDIASRFGLDDADDSEDEDEDEE